MLSAREHTPLTVVDIPQEIQWAFTATCMLTAKYQPLREELALKRSFLYNVVNMNLSNCQTAAQLSICVCILLQRRDALNESYMTI